MEDVKTITIECETPVEAFRIASQFHNQLKGNKHYKDNDVILSFENSTVQVTVASGIDIPPITIDWSMQRD